MNFTNVVRAASIGLILAAGSGPVLASPQNHHCKQSDGTMDTGKTKKQCLAAKGTWTKDAAAAPAAPKAATPVAPAAAPKS